MNEQIEVLVQQGSCMVSAILVTVFTHGLQKITPFAVEITKEFSLNRLFKFLIMCCFSRSWLILFRESYIRISLIFSDRKQMRTGLSFVISDV